jgi:hypothetical protein
MNTKARTPIIYHGGMSGARKSPSDSHDLLCRRLRIPPAGRGSHPRILDQVAVGAFVNRLDEAIHGLAAIKKVI